MAFHPNAQQRLVTIDGFDPVDSMAKALRSRQGAPWDNITDFITHPSFCGITKVYPRQRTLQKLIFLETENMTDYDLEVIEGWRQGFMRRRDVFGVQPDIWERIKYLKARGARRFPHVQYVGGRRGSKGFNGGILGAEQIAYLYSLDDWQTYYGVDTGKDGYLQIGATSQTQAKAQLFADVRSVVERCAYLQPHIAETKDYMLSVRTPADIRRIAEMRAANVPIDHLVATIKAQALSATSAAFRGATAFGLFLDEFAFMVETGSSKSGDAIYEDASPSLDQFDLDSLTYIPSSPYCLEPSTKVLTEDLCWVPVGSLAVGDKLIGFDEFAPGGKGRGRTWQPATVTETSVIQAPRYEITMQSGKKIVSTGEHLWLTSWASQVTRFDWRKTKDLQPGDRIKTLGVDPWDEDQSRDGGYLAGFFDGEGFFSGQGGQALLGASQNPGVVLDKVYGLLAERGFEVRETNDGRRCRHFYLTGGFSEIARFMGMLRPERLLPKFTPRLYGSRIYGRGGPAVDRVVSVVKKDIGPVVALGTSTNTLIAEGLLSHNTKTGKCYNLYQEGSVLMSSYTDSEGIGEEARDRLQALAAKRGEDADDVTANPTMLIIQLPSWGLYQDWEQSQKLIGVAFKRAIQPGPEHESQKRRQLRNPDKFRVERMAQWAEVVGAYFDEGKVEAMFKPLAWRPPLEAQSRGYLKHKYRIHCDPGRTGANFAMCIGHEELVCATCEWTPEKPSMTHPANGCLKNQVRPHVIIDFLHVWRPQDFPPDVETGRPTIDYVQVREEIEGVLRRFPSTSRASFDQWNSAGLIADLRKKFSPGIRVTEVTFTEKENQARFEKVKSALNLGWVSSYRDSFFEDGGSLLEMELKFLSEKNGRVVKQDIGPVTTKDLSDCLCVVVSDLLHDALERYGADGSMAVGSAGSTDVAGLRSGRELERVASLGSANPNKARQAMANLSRDRRNTYVPSRAGSIYARRGN